MLFLSALTTLAASAMLLPPRAPLIADSAPDSPPGAVPAPPGDAIRPVLRRAPSGTLPHHVRLHAAALDIDRDALERFAQAGGGLLPAVPLDALNAFDLELRPKSPWSASASMSVAGAHGLAIRPMARAGTFLAGTVAGAPDSTAFLAATAAGVFGFIEWGSDRWIISSGPFGAGLPTVSYRVAELPPGLIESPEWLCEAVGAAAEAPPGDGGVAGSACRQLRLAFDTDHQLLSVFDGDLEALEGYVGTVAAALDTIYSRDLATQITATHLRVFTEDDDPWPDTTVNAQIAQLYAEWEPELDAIPRDAVQLLCAANIGGGVAYTNGICSNYAYSVVGNITGYFPSPLLNNVLQNWDIFASAHELGHNFSLPHTHAMTPPADGCGSSPQDCGVAFAKAGTLMSYCHLCPGGISNIRLEFHLQSVALAEAYLASVPCDYSGASLPPVVVSDGATAVAGTPLAVDVLANELDGNCEPIEISAFSAASARGGVIARSAGTGPDGRDELVYSIARGAASGLDSFTYTVADASGQSSTADVIVTVLAPRVPENPVGAIAEIDASYFVLTSEVALPDFGSRVPYVQGTVQRIDFAPSVGAFASSGRSDLVGARFTGWITVPEDGVWDFFVASDEGARLSLGEQVVVNHDGIHAFSSRMGTVALEAGTHAFTLDYFERTGSAGLRLSWRSPDGVAETVPSSAFSRRGSDTRADIDNDGRVAASDVAALLTAWGTATPAADVSGDGLVGPQDLASVLFEWTG